MVFLKLVAARRMAGLFMVKGWAWRFLGSAGHQWLKHHSEGSWWVPHEGKEEEVCFSELLNICFSVDGKPSGVSSLGPCVDFFKELKIWRWQRRNVLNRTPNPNWQQPSNSTQNHTSCTRPNNRSATRTWTRNPPAPTPAPSSLISADNHHHQDLRSSCR